MLYYPKQQRERERRRKACSDRILKMKNDAKKLYGKASGKPLSPSIRLHVEA